MGTKTKVVITAFLISLTLSLLGCGSFRSWLVDNWDSIGEVLDNDASSSSVSVSST